MAIILLGNKVDLESEGKREVSYQEASKTAKKWGIPYMETSAKNNMNIKEVFLFPFIFPIVCFFFQPALEILLLIL